MATRVVVPLVNEYGDRLVVMGLNIATENGNPVYRAAMEHLEVPEDRQVVPFLLVGDQALIGGGEIEAELPGIVSAGLENGGIDWPDIPALEAMFDAADATVEARAAAASGTPPAEPAAEGTAQAEGPDLPPSATPEPTVAPSATPTVEDAPPAGDSGTGLLLGAAGAAAVALAAAGVVWYRRRG